MATKTFTEEELAQAQEQLRLQQEEEKAAIEEANAKTAEEERLTNIEQFKWNLLDIADGVNPTATIPELARLIAQIFFPANTGVGRPPPEERKLQTE